MNDKGRYGQYPEASAPGTFHAAALATEIRSRLFTAVPFAATTIEQTGANAAKACPTHERRKVSVPQFISDRTPARSAQFATMVYEIIHCNQALLFMGRSRMTSETRVATLAFLGVVCLKVGLAQSPVPAETPSISGVVSGTDGKLLRRVTVHLSTPKPVIGPNLAMMAFVPDRVTETDAQGNFSFDDIAPGGYVVEAERTGYLTGGEMVRITSGQKITGLVIKMIPQGIIAGSVVDDEGEILSGATVNISTYSPPKECPSCVILGGSGTGTTDADGAILDWGPAPGPIFDIRGAAAEHVAGRQTSNVSRSAGNLRHNLLSRSYRSRRRHAG